MGWPVTVSLGAAIHLDPPESAEDLIKSADRLMLQAKSEGKNKVIYKIFESPQHRENLLLHFERFCLGTTVHSN